VDKSTEQEMFQIMCFLSYACGKSSRIFSQRYRRRALYITQIMQRNIC